MTSCAWAKRKYGEVKKNLGNVLHSSDRAGHRLPTRSEFLPTKIGSVRICHRIFRIESPLSVNSFPLLRFQARTALVYLSHGGPRRPYRVR